jgi:tRNA (Thr-GGU) A37 N-methylase
MAVTRKSRRAESIRLRPVGVLRSTLESRVGAPQQGDVVRAIDGLRLRIGPIEAMDGTPVVDIKPLLRVWSGYV